MHLTQSVLLVLLVFVVACISPKQNNVFETAEHAVLPTDDTDATKINI